MKSVTNIVFRRTVNNSANLLRDLFGYDITDEIWLSTSDKVNNEIGNYTGNQFWWLIYDNVFVGKKKEEKINL